VLGKLEESTGGLCIRIFFLVKEPGTLDELEESTGRHFVSFGYECNMIKLEDSGETLPSVRL
jgi:hypothetical protein